LQIAREEAAVLKEGGGEHSLDLEDGQGLLVAALGEGILLHAVEGVPHQGNEKVEKNDGVADAAQAEYDGDEWRDQRAIQGTVHTKEGRRKRRGGRKGG
jgi:hypothetical protein